MAAETPSIRPALPANMFTQNRSAVTRRRYNFRQKPGLQNRYRQPLGHILLPRNIYLPGTDSLPRSSGRGWPTSIWCWTLWKTEVTPLQKAKAYRAYPWPLSTEFEGTWFLVQWLENVTHAMYA
jgi:hypothetical protein